MIIIIVIIIVLIIVVIVIIITGLTYFDCPQQTTRLGNIFYVQTTRLQYGDDL